MNSINEINWYPGHMKKAVDRIKEKLKECDGVIEIGDARAPVSSFPDYLDSIVGEKNRVLIFSKVDLADQQILNKRLKEYSDQGVKAFCLDLRDYKSCKPMLNYLSSLKTKQDEKYAKLGFPAPAKRYMVLGIPNVGKSTFINTLSKKKKAAVENRPGKTRTETLIKVNDSLSIFDSPGVLEPNYEDKNEITKLALLGSVKAEILPLIALSDYCLDFLKENYSSYVTERYGVTISEPYEEVFINIAKNRNFLLPEGKHDEMRARITLLNDFKSGALGKVCLDV